MSRLKAAATAACLGVLLAGCATESARLDSGAVSAYAQIGPGALNTAPNTVPDRFRRQVVADPTGEKPGTIVVDTPNNYLYLVLDDGQAMRYGIGVGREGFSWNGSASVGRKAQWPGWTPPAAMRKRQPGLPAYMPGGPMNPLGARALYLYRGGNDTLYRIHGTNEDWSIGQNVSSGCIRLTNTDIMDLYQRVPSGTRVKVI